MALVTKAIMFFSPALKLTLILRSPLPALSTRMQIHTGHVTDVHCDRDSKFLLALNC